MLESILETSANGNAKLQEFSLGAKFIYHFCDLEYHPFAGGSDSLSDKIINYYKIHGSLNWLYCEEHGLQ